MKLQPQSVRLFKIALAQKGILMADLAAAIGVDRAHLSALVHGKVHFPIMARKVDLFFGKPLLTPAFEFSHFSMINEAIGIDPVTSTMAALRRRAVELGVESPEKLTREHLITKMVGAAASKAKAEREQKSTRSKITLGMAVEALGPIPGIPSPSRPRRSAAAGQSKKNQTKNESSKQ